MKVHISQKRELQSPKSEYSVEFEGIAKFLAYFEDTVSLTDRQIIARGLQIAQGTFGHNGSITLERSAVNGDSYAITTYGVDPYSGHILGRPALLRPALRLVKVAE